jgi:fused signal recognition particle receptor
MPFWRRQRPEDATPAEGGDASDAEATAAEPAAADTHAGAVDDSGISDEELEAEALAAAESAAFDAGMAPSPWAYVAPAVVPVPEGQSVPAVADPAEAPADGWLWDAEAAGIEAGVQKSRSGFMGRLRSLLGAADAAGPSWDDVEETLIAGDVGGVLAMEIVERARKRHDPEGPEAAVRAELAAILAPGEPDWMPAPVAPGAPAVVLVVGVNGTGKTTTIGKLAARYHAQGHRIVLAAGDTFRAAAIDQLRIWADRSGSEIVAHAPGADPGAVVYDALDAAAARRADIVIADTAGRLHTKSNLMDELAKIRRIVDKRFPGASPEALFVLDATTGQNGLAQAKAFHETVGLTGIVLTKLDSTSKGGIVFAIEDALAVPVRYVGVGERVGDLIPFDPEAFVAALFG